jgi:hypothetical protein
VNGTEAAEGYSFPSKNSYGRGKEEAGAPFEPFGYLKVISIPTPLLYFPVFLQILALIFLTSSGVGVS